MFQTDHSLRAEPGLYPLPVFPLSSELRGLRSDIWILWDLDVHFNSSFCTHSVCFIKRMFFLMKR